MKNIQNTIISDIESEVEEIKKSAPPVKKESGLKLSAVTKQGLVEAQRKQKTAKLSPAQMQMVNAKQKDMDMSYELYCDTFASVLKILTDNDAELATLTEPAKNGVLADHKQQLSEELDEFIELLGQN
uniref:Periphilin-1 C-terminal domain-containing protein n=1 Tax=Plectus sambesii TaxID=2011161 RepID=A0A914W7A0_9BILA